MTENEARDKIFITADFTDIGRAPQLLRLANELHGIKVGQQQHDKMPWKRMVSMIKHYNVEHIYLDAKYIEGPDQMADIIDKDSELEVDYINIHAAAGATALQKAVEFSGDRAKPVASTISSDMTEAECREIYGSGSKETVARLAAIAVQNGVEFVTCAAEDIPTLRSYPVTRYAKVIATGIRMPGDPAHDQIRTSTPREAIELGADFLAIGRSITEGVEPKSVIEKIIVDMTLATSV